MPAKNQPGSQDSFDSFIHDLLDIQTPPQYAEQLRQQPTSKRTDATADKSALYRKALVAQLAFAPAQRQQQYQQERQRCLPCQSTVQQHPCSAQPSQASLHHLMSIAHTARQQVHQHVQKQTVLAKRQAMLQHCLKIKQHATAVASQQQQQQQAPRGGPSLGFPDLLLYWAKGLALQRSESVLLACHLWKKVQPQVSARSSACSSVLCRAMLCYAVACKLAAVNSVAATAICLLQHILSPWPTCAISMPYSSSPFCCCLLTSVCDSRRSALHTCISWVLSVSGKPCLWAACG